MESVVQFIVDDTSPTIHYSPFADTFTTPNLGAGWNPYFNISGFAASIGEVGNGTSLHITSLDGASLAFQWRGTGIQLQGNVTLASYSVTIDGQSVSVNTDSTQTGSNVLVNMQGLEDVAHNITLTAQIPQGQNPPNSSMLVFDKAIITSSSIPVSSNTSFRQDIVVDNDIAFLGRWSFEQIPTGSSFHTSSTVGDRAMATFNGTALLIRGTTSPGAANYSVTLDNVTNSFSARSSFTDYESLLFFASGLDPNAMHSVEVRNQGGGELSLLVDGFSTFVSYKQVSHRLPLLSFTNLSRSLPVPPDSSPTAGATSNMSFPKGTIAAFVLAGILAFILLAGFLFFFLWYRPRRRRSGQQVHHFVTTGLEDNSKGGGIDNANTTGEGNYGKGEPFEELSPISPVVDNQRLSGMSGFARWRREAVRGSFGGMSLPLHFRHSGSAEEKSPETIQERPRSEQSFPTSSDSSAKRKARAKSKGKARQITGRSWSPSFTLDLPLQQQGHRQSAGQNSARITSMGHLSSFVAAEPSPQALRNPAPPSYAMSVSNSGSTQDFNHINNSISNSTSASDPSAGIPSGPRSVSHSPVNVSYPRTHFRENSHGFLLHEGEPSSDPDSQEDTYAHQQLTGPEVIPMRPLTRYDGVSVTTEDNPSITEPSTMRQVLRSLSPRTSEAPQRQPQWRENRTRHSVLVPPSVESPSVHVPPEHEQAEEQNKPELKIRPLPRPPASSTSEEDVEVKDGVFLSVRATSPFHVDFDSRSARLASDESSDGAYATASTGKNASTQPTGSPRRLPVPPTVQMPEFIQGTSRLPFRLTPIKFPRPLMSTSPQSSSKQPSEGHSDGVTSFLDLTVSREGSMRSRSIFTGSDQEKVINEGRLSLPGVTEPRSRWSNTTVPSIATNLPPAPANDSSGESQKLSPSEGLSTDSSTFPIAVQVNIPPSPHHIMDYNLPQARHSRTSRVSGFTQAGDHLHIHPHLEDMDSPTESIPISVSDLHFRHSDSEDLSQRNTVVEGPTHPPLPGNSVEEYPRRAFDPSIIVNRVLGLPSPILTSADHSRSASTAAPTPSFSAFSQRPSNNTSNERLDPSSTSGHPFS
ncbi:hypothetical protein JR316_0001776 [Psilocybe cubensis]|uniref:Uncharacterized protein n=2 Tax=Psilocybe cubensis TaxID=181762 RepID=A0ACB8HB18_PSICU|nr:hypothetical protein JR316_0001776 [Psilocybe cubensis]KAH9484874.1 hypothetical protein JR316_0001776 [Psilocybe cubensis]